jgi:hypothetical protein
MALNQIVFSMLIIAFICAVLGIFKKHQENTIRTLVFVPNDTDSFWHPVLQTDGRKFTQIRLCGRVTNIHTQPICLTAIQLISPKKCKVVEKNIYPNKHAIFSSSWTEFDSNFFIENLIGKLGKPLSIIVSITDQIGNSHKVKYLLTCR